MGFMQMGIRFLGKRKVQSILTVCAIILGVGILTGVNVTADSIETGINREINAKLGNNDIIMRANRSIDGGWFSYTEAADYLENYGDVEAYVPRIIRSHRSYPLTNHSGGWNTMAVAIDPQNPQERGFGVCNITAALSPELVNTSRIEDLFQNHLEITLPVVLSEAYANSFGIEPGDPFYVFPENPDFFGGMDPGNTTTWINATVIGIIQDTSVAVQDFMPPARMRDLYPPSRAVYFDLNRAWSYVFNNHMNQINMMFIQASSPTQISTLRSNLESNPPEGVFPGGVFTENAKSLFTDGILQVNFLMRGIFSIFSGKWFPSRPGMKQCTVRTR